MDPDEVLVSDYPELPPSFVQELKRETYNRVMARQRQYAGTFLGDFSFAGD